jgi:anti-sigma factor RsiW
MMRCRLFQDDFHLYLYGELPQPRSIEILEHLSGCPDCREEVDRLREWMGEVRRISEAAGSPVFWREYRRALRRRVPEIGRERGRAWVQRPALLIPMAFLFGIVLTVLLTRYSPTSRPTESVAVPKAHEVAAAGESFDLIENLGMFENLTLLEQMDGLTDLPKSPDSPDSNNGQPAPGKQESGAERVTHG